MRDFVNINSYGRDISSGYGYGGTYLGATDIPDVDEIEDPDVFNNGYYSTSEYIPTNSAYSHQNYQEPYFGEYEDRTYDPIELSDPFDELELTSSHSNTFTYSTGNPLSAPFTPNATGRLFNKFNVPMALGGEMIVGGTANHSLAENLVQRDNNTINEQRIRLRPVSELPDVYRAIFKFGVFNAIQSKCFDTVMRTKDSMVISAPTGSGKTVIFELAIIQMLSSSTDLKDGSVKCVYMAPTKALCSERFKDWKNKFEPLGIKCCEMTGDTVQFGNNAWKEVKDSTIIITTGEKWDSLTRNWQSHGGLLSLIKLFMVDEVHILNESRGSTVEVVISRMKLKGLAIRFVLVSATVPNINDVAEWIGSGGCESKNSSGPATVFEFGANFRPCKLTRFVYGYPRKNQNDFQFTRTLDFKLYSILQQHSIGKPVLIFCSTRKGVSGTAEQLAKDFEKAQELRQNLPWSIPKKVGQVFLDKRLEKLAALGIGVHHAGLNLDDRRATEDLFLSGILRVVVATSTLAVGVNLPAHTVVIKGVKIFQNNAWCEYSDLDIIQMIGRAGRPQFDKEGVAIVLCETELERKYRELAHGETLLESCLHQNLLEHINSEVGLGTIQTVGDARNWLYNSFLCQRIKRNATYYGLDKASNQTWQDRLAMMVTDAVKELGIAELLTCNGGNGDDIDAKIVSTEFGDIMSKYYIRHNTMAQILRLPPRALTRDILEIIAEAEEFGDVKLRGGERQVYNKLKDHLDIRFKLKRVDKASDKVFVLIQAVLGGISLSAPEYKTADSQPSLDALTVFRHAARISRVVVEVAIVKKNGCQLKHGLELLRCLTAKAWEDRPIVLRQVESIGEKSVKVLAEHGINSLQMLRQQEASRIELLLNRRAPFGHEVLAFLKELPIYVLRVDEEQIYTFSGKKPVEVDLKIECSLGQIVAESSRKHKNRSFGMTSILTVTSENDFIDFRRISTKALRDSKSFGVNVKLSKPSQTVCVYISSETIAGLNVSAIYKPTIDASQYPTMDTRPMSSLERELEELAEDPEFWNMNLEDSIEDSHTITAPADHTNSEIKNSPSKKSMLPIKQNEVLRLANGKYACNHSCKDKTKCRHLCCREGVERPPPISKRTLSDSKAGITPSNTTQVKLETATTKKPQTMSEVSSRKGSKQSDNRFQRLESLHSRAEIDDAMKIRQKLLLDKNATSKPSPDFNIEFATLKGSQDRLKNFEDDDDDLPDSIELLAKRPKCPSKSSSRYSDPELDALLLNAPLDALAFLDVQSINKTPDRNKMSKRPLAEVLATPAPESPTVVGSTSPPQKRHKRGNISTNIGEDSYNHERALLMSSRAHGRQKSPLFLSSSPRKADYEMEEPVIHQAILEPQENDEVLEEQQAVSFLFNESLLEIEPNFSSRSMSKRISSPSPIQGEDNSVPNDEVMPEETYNDELADFEAWLLSGAVEIIET